MVLFLVFFQSIGVRFLPFQGVLLCCLILLIVPFSQIKFPKRDVFIIFSFASIVFIQSIRGGGTIVVYQLLVLASSVVVVKWFNGHWIQVRTNLMNLLWYLSLHGLLVYLFYLAFSGIFTTRIIGGMPYLGFGPLLVATDGTSSRAMGIFWEPGVFQFVTVICMFLGIRQNKSMIWLFIPFASLVATKSTAGIFSSIPLGVYWISRQRISISSIISVPIFASALALAYLLFFKENISNKVIEQSTSALIRQRDFLIGLELVKDKPVFGHGVFIPNSIARIDYVSALDYEILGSDFINLTGPLAGGFTNGFFSILAWYGLPVGALLYFLFLKNKFMDGATQSICFFVACVATFQSEPITSTTFFMIFTVSGLISGSEPVASEDRICCS